MFEAAIYKNRRNQLISKLDKGILLFLGNNESPMNYPANVYPFRQDSTFLYYFGIDLPGLAAIIDLDEQNEILFGDDFSVDDIVWMGPQPKMAELAAKAALTQVAPSAQLKEYLSKALQQDRKIHFLPPYRQDNMIKLQEILGIRANQLKHYASVPFIKAVVEQRSVKSEEEIEEIEKALDITYQIHLEAMKSVRPGLKEYEVAGILQGKAFSLGGRLSFPLIFSVHGEILHNPFQLNEMQKGQLLVIDCGGEAPSRYAGDITRTLPVTGKFSEEQKAVYQIVLNAQTTAIEMIKPGIKYRDVHLEAAKVITLGLKELGLMKGNIEEAVQAGAHALFFPHGLGHMMGLDVHDMEDLGEDYVGYDEKIKRSDQFGLAYLRLARELKPGFVLTVEPGIYFIPQLIDLWQKDNKFSQFINYERLEAYRHFGGIRIEDDILVTENGSRVLGKLIPKQIDGIEAIMQG
ncbi:MAG: aminopeptidase P family protein [Caldisericaceae bacterium]|nr:aminopeptidase P family protein [Caldisericaceae bacterium]